MTSMTNETCSDTDTDYDSGISLNGQDEIEEFEKLLRDREGSNSRQVWKLGWSPLGGRGIIANSDIKSGDVIFTNSPVVEGPRGGIEGEAICVSCFQCGVHLKPCTKGCRLPVCSASCQESHSNSPECSLLLRLGVQEGDSWSPELYRALTPFRCISLPRRDKEIIKMLQAHPPSGLATEIKLLKRSLKGELSAEDQRWMDHCCRVLDASSFQSFTDNIDSKQSLMRGIYPLAGMLNHSCTPNSKQVFGSNRRLKLVAVKPIAKGEEITISYCPLLWATPIRITFLLKTKHFICSCQRCRDPTELGTYLAGLTCSCGGMILPVEPLEPKSEWKCSGCAKSLSSGQALVASSLLASNPGKSKINLSLSMNNHMVLDSTLRAIFSQRNNLQDMNASELTERENKIKHILELIDQLQLGECRTKGLLFNEMYTTLREKEIRNLEHSYKDIKGLLENSRRILEGDISVPKDILQNLTQANFK